MHVVASQLRQIEPWYHELNGDRPSRLLLVSRARGGTERAEMRLFGDHFFSLLRLRLIFNLLRFFSPRLRIRDINDSHDLLLYPRRLLLLFCKHIMLLRYLLTQLFALLCFSFQLFLNFSKLLLGSSSFVVHQEAQALLIVLAGHA